MTKRERLIRWIEYRGPLLITFIEVFLACIPIAQRIVQELPSKTFREIVGENWLLILFELALIVLCLILLCSQWRKNKQYYAIVKRDQLSKATLIALKEANENRRRAVLRTTYGNVPEWNPLDYTRNILVHDEHEHIRTILYSLLKLIVDVTDGLTENDITVDLIACYPTKEYDGSIPCMVLKSTIDNQGTLSNYIKNPWRIITSGDHTSGGSITAYLTRNDSFYAYIHEFGYEFCNDKAETDSTDSDIERKDYQIERGTIPYILTKSDRNNNQGSIVGLEIELRNDAPETPFVKGILTISTYGKKLYEKDIHISEEEYKVIFKECILDSFKALIRSEFAQIYIRHALRDGLMCPKTGRLLMNEDKTAIISEESATYSCPWSGKKCRFSKRYCQTCAQIETGWLEKCLKTE